MIKMYRNKIHKCHKLINLIQELKWKVNYDYM